MISVNDFKTGTTIEYEDNIWQVIEFQHVKPGKGAALSVLNYVIYEMGIFKKKLSVLVKK